MRALVELGANVACAGKDGRTPLHMAAMRGEADCVRALVELGANLACADSKRPDTPLDAARVASQAVSFLATSSLRGVVFTCTSLLFMFFWACRDAVRFRRLRHLHTAWLLARYVTRRYKHVLCGILLATFMPHVWRAAMLLARSAGLRGDHPLEA